MYDVVTFGSAVHDIFIDTNIHEERNMISYPVGSKLLIKDAKVDVGGGGTNTAVAFSRLGLRTGYIGKVGSDGKNIVDLLKKEKVSFLGKIEKKKISGCSIILDSKEHNRTILTYKGVNDEVRLNDIRFFKTKWIYYSSLLGDSFNTQFELAKALTKKGVKLAFNPSDYLIKRKNLKSLLRLCDIVILNKEEAKLLVKKGDLLEGLYKLGVKIVVITNKNKLISCYDGYKKYYLKPHKVKVVERTGAGDAFASSFVAGIIRGLSIDGSLKLGLKNSESVIKYFGAKNKLIRW